MQKLIPIVVVVVAVAGACAFLFLRPAGKPPAATYTVQDLLVYPENAPAGGVVYVTAVVRSLKAGPADVTLEIVETGETLSKSVEFENEDQVLPVDFTPVVSKLGSLQVKVGEISKTIQVREALPPSFKVTKLTGPSTAVKGREVEVIAEVANEGEREGTYTGRISLNGTPVTPAKSEIVGPKSKKVISFKFTASQSGLLTIENYPGSLSLTVVEPYSRLEYLALEVPSTAYEGEVDVEVRVKNDGNVENELSIALTTNPQLEPIRYSPSQRIRLAPNEEKIVTVTYNMGPGNYTIQAGGLSKSLIVKSTPTVKVKEIALPQLAVVGSQISVKIKVSGSGTFTEEPKVEIEGSPVTTTPRQVSVSVSGEEKEVAVTFTAGQKGLCTFELGGKKKSFQVVGYQEVYLPGDYIKYSYTSDTSIPQLGQKIQDSGEFLLKYEGKENFGGMECRKIKREITSSTQYSGSGNYDVLYTPDTDREGFLYQASSYRKGGVASELMYDKPLKILSFPLSQGPNATGSANVTIRNYQPIELSVTGSCTAESKIEGVETVPEVGVQGIKMVITLQVKGKATFRGQTSDVDSTTTITRYVNQVGVVLKETTETTSKTKYSGIDITLIDKQTIILKELHLSRLTSL
jgi:hypothetical protein